jgi:hypothetical protein
VYKGKDENETFINNWLESMFKDAGRIYRDEYVYYAKLNLPKCILRKLGSTEENPHNISIKVLGFNSKKFDVNIFINYITNPKIHIPNIISIDVQFKSFVLHHDDYPYDLHFLDLKSFLAEGNLDKYASKFAVKSDSEPPKQKGVFPYEFLNDENYFEELSKPDLFKFEDFNSSLKDSNISVDEYYSYLKLAKHFKTRLEYLEWYNTQDVIIMCPIIDFLINKFEENNIDMLRNISLS